MEARMQVNIHANIYADLYNGIVKEVSDEDMAARECLASRGFSFTTSVYEYEVTESELGKQYRFASGQNFNESPLRYVGVDKVYAIDDVIAEMEEALTRLQADQETHSNSLASFSSGTLDAYKTTAEIQIGRASCRERV